MWVETETSDQTQFRKAWSPSSVNLFLQCSLKYWFEKGARWQSQPSEALVSGNIVHGVLEDLFLKPAGERTREAARQSYMRHQERQMQGLEDVIDFGVVRERSGEAINSYFASENPDDVTIATNGIERSISGQVADVPLEGRIDRLEQSETGLRIVDYKTGTPKPAYMESNWRQQMLYAAASDQAIDDGEITEVALFYLGEEPRLLVRPVTKFATTNVSDVLRRVNEDREEFHAESRWQAKTGPLCKYCAFQIVCPAKRKRAPTPGSSESEAKLAESPEVYKRESRLTAASHATSEEKE